MDITQAPCKLCARVMREPLNLSRFTRKLKQKLMVLLASDAALTGHILSETTRDDSTSYADNGSLYS